MILKYHHLRHHPAVFKSMTGLRLAEFDHLTQDVSPQFQQAEQQRLSRPNRQRDLGGGRPAELSAQNQLLLTVIWLRVYPTHEVLAYLFGISDSTVSRVIQRVLPLLEQAGRDSMRMPDPGRKRRRTLDQLLVETAGLAVVIDTYEQRVQRPQDRAERDAHYSGKKKMHTRKIQVVADEDSGKVVSIYGSVPGPTADLEVLRQSRLMEQLPPGVGGIGDLAYVGIGGLHPQGLGACPRKKPRGRERPPQDQAYNQAFARRRIVVEITIGRMRRYQSLNQTDREHRRYLGARAAAVAGLVNRQLAARFPA